MAVPVVVTAHPVLSPDHLRQIGMLALLAGTGVVASVVQSFLKRDGWSKATNHLIALGYAFVIAVLDLWLKGKLDAINLVPAFLAVYGAAQAWYATLFVVSQSESSTTVPVTTNP